VLARGSEFKHIALVPANAFGLSELLHLYCGLRLKKTFCFSLLVLGTVAVEGLSPNRVESQCAAPNQANREARAVLGMQRFSPAEGSFGKEK
jgi:hypothetical protein